VVLSLLNWTDLARVRARQDPRLARRGLCGGGAPARWRAIRASCSGHLLPGFTSHIIVVLTMSVPSMILGETSLSFLGLGLRAPIVSWGVMLQDCLSIQRVPDYPWLLMRW